MPSVGLWYTLIGFFLYSAPAPNQVLLEVEMRFEQIITAVTRPVVIATVREIKAVVSFANDMCLHLWLQRMSLGMPAYPDALCMSPGGDLGRHDSGPFGSKHDKLRLQPKLALVSCPAGIRNA